MRRTHLVCGFIAVLAIAAVCQAYQPAFYAEPFLFDSPYSLTPHSGHTQVACAIPSSAPETTKTTVPAQKPCCCPKASAPACCCNTDAPACHPGKGAQTPACCPQPVATGFQAPTTPSSPACCCNPKAQAMRTNTVTRDAQGRIFLNGMVVIGGAKPPSLEDLLEKLEAIKAKQAALDEEVKATQALVNLKFKAVVEKVSKLGASDLGSAQPPAAAPTAYYYEPNVGYRTTLVKDPKSGEVKRVVTGVTTYIIRERSVPASPAVVVPPPAAPGMDPITDENAPPPATKPAQEPESKSDAPPSEGATEGKLQTAPRKPRGVSPKWYFGAGDSFKW